MRVLYLLNCYPQISETYIKTELDWVSRQHEVRIVSFGAADIAYRQHLPFERIAANDRQRLSEIVRDFAPDMVHGHYIHLTPWCFFAARTAGVKFTIRAHSFDVLGPDLTRFAKLPVAINSELCAGVLTFPFTFDRIVATGIRRDRLIPCWPVVDVGRFLDRGPNGDAVMNVGAAIEKKAMESYVDIASAIPERHFNLYSLGYLTDRLRAYNAGRGAPVHFVDTIQPEDMPPQYKKHEWLLYTADPRYNTVGWPLAVAEAQAAGVGVIMRGLRPDLAEYVGPCGFLYDNDADAIARLRTRFPEELRQQGFEQARRSDIAGHIQLLYQLWS